ncbi:MAG: hypothetical protein DRJ51_03030 [Thermoprotei archaeon]|nr:MAG: hypothetical protein DRJ51_03030 [Thermoprotei archaeon]RLF02315.1 MAG: hypothetical protein DRJ59_03940 [Thermoprotei archaeon]
MSHPDFKLVKNYKVEIVRHNDRDYLCLTLITEEGDSNKYLIEWGIFARSLARDILHWSSEIAIRDQYISRL